jgi:hypothetical protein
MTNAIVEMKNTMQSANRLEQKEMAGGSIIVTVLHVHNFRRCE